MQKKIFRVVLSFACLISLAACGGKTSDHSDAGKNTIEKNVNSEKEHIYTTEKGEEEAVVDDTTTADSEIIVADSDISILTDEEIEMARKAALDYYSHTVFEVNSLTYVEPNTDKRFHGECNFLVNVSKDGIVQEPDRMIMLDKKDGIWEVTNEGF